MTLSSVVLAVLGVYALGLLCLTIDSVRAGYPLMLKRRGRMRPHWVAWADIGCWPLWMLACMSSWSANHIGDFADWIMRKADAWGEGLMNPLFDIIDPPVEPKRGGDHG